MRNSGTKLSISSQTESEPATTALTTLGLVLVEWQLITASAATAEFDPKVRITWGTDQALYSVDADAKYGRICFPAERAFNVSSFVKSGNGASSVLNVSAQQWTTYVQWQAKYTFFFASLDPFPPGPAPLPASQTSLRTIPNRAWRYSVLTSKSGGDRSVVFIGNDGTADITETFAGEQAIGTVSERERQFKIGNTHATVSVIPTVVFSIGDSQL